MPVQINGATSGSATLQATDATTVTLTLPATSGTLVTTAGGGSPTFTTVTATTVATSNLTVGGTALGAGNASIMKNRIINGAMVIDQRNAGASGSTYNVYSLDRWYINNNTGSSRFTWQQNAGSVTPPVGFTNYLGITSTGAYSITSSSVIGVYQAVEGYNIADLAWGTANAKTVTLSFQVYSSLTGTFGGVVKSPSSNASYPYTFTVSSANTWTPVSVTIAGPTIGTWPTNNTAGMEVWVGLGVGSTYSATSGTWTSSAIYGATGATSVVGTNGATFYITGVQLEVGSSATGFEYRMYQQELALCQRYCYAFAGVGGYSSMPLVGFVQASGNVARLETTFPVTMRGAPSLTTPAANSIIIQGPGGTNYTPTVLALTTNSAQLQSAFIDATVSGQANYSCIVFDNNSTASKFIFSAEL